MDHPSGVSAEDLRRAYQTFNEVLFFGTLPEVLLTFSTGKKQPGFLRAESFRHEPSGRLIHEVALNPQLYTTQESMLLDLAHLCVHVWQHTDGTPARNGGHNAEWSERAVLAGLDPQHPDNPEKTTGPRIVTTLIPDSPLEEALNTLKAERYALHYVPHQPAIDSPGDPGEVKPEKKRTSKHRYSCPKCGANAWASKSAAGRFKCADCDLLLERQEDDHKGDDPED